MASNINPNNIDGTYPIEGINNDSQGFRTNFVNISTNFQSAKDEIEELQAGVTPAANLGTVTGSVDINYNLAPYQHLVTSGPITFTFSNFPSANYGVIRVEVDVQNVSHTLTLPATAVNGVDFIDGYAANVITFSATGVFVFEIYTYDNTTFTVNDITRDATGGGGGGGGVPNGGTVGQILVKQSATDGDADWVDQGSVPASATEYCPGYTSYTRVDDNEFTIDLVDAANLFRVGRRVKFDQSGTFDYGSISAVDFNSTSPNDTHVTLTMEGADTVPVGTFDVCLVSGTAAWSPIAGDPFGGTAINDIATGLIGVTQWWVAVGDGGKLATSTDAGATWTIRTTGTTENLYAVGYASDIEEFLAGGAVGVLLDSSNGTTWNLDTTSLPALATTGDGEVARHGILRYEGGTNQWAARAAYTTNNAIFYDQGTGVWAGPGQQLGTAFFGEMYNDPQGNTLFTSSGNDDIGTLTDPTDVSASAYITSAFGNLENILGWELHGILTNRVFTFVTDAGSVKCFNNTLADSEDDLTFNGNPLRDVVYSPLHTRVVVVGDNASIGWLDDSGRTTADNVTAVTTGFAPLSNILAVAWNETDGMFVAVADNGQIARSTNGTN